jgi:hypothetical protein
VARSLTWRAAVALALALAVATTSPPALADDPPPAPRVYHVPTAWLLPAGANWATIGANHRGGAFASYAAGLGGIAEIDVSVIDSMVGCETCSGTDRDTAELTPITALFKVGVGPGRLGAWQPAIALGFRRSITARDRRVGDGLVEPELAQLYLVASWRLSLFELHVGGDLWDGLSAPDGPRLSAAPVADQLRPFAGASWRSRRYPRTSLLADVAWTPEMRATAAGPLRPELAWVAGFGVRYQALRWGSVELGVRARQRDAENLVAMLRFNATWDR